MSTRRTQFFNEEYYHAFNRGVDKRDIFLEAKDYDRFLLSMNLLNDKNDGLMIEWRDYKKVNPKNSLDDFLKGTFRKSDPLVEIIAYCLNPNHYHFILKQIEDRGIERFMHKIGTSHTKYFNNKNKRSGALFQGVFKSIHIDSNEYFLYLSAYVNKNNFIHNYTTGDDWKYSSLSYYLGKRNDNFIDINTNTVLGQFGDLADYAEFMKKNALHMKDKKGMVRYLIEE
ncbi:MAG: Transposase [Candidatus Moranbacteria bacterium GW2011_GWA2_39_41]|nr:MAG: Transposase [Candidatus Moranbacteria bacterium GW2011_GWA2_39_41]